MNRLPFGSFHAAHFSPQHIQQWQSYLQNIPIFSSDYSHQAQEPSNGSHEESRQSEQDVNGLSLSKEAMEIFEFSESYSKEQQQASSDNDDIESERKQHEANAMLDLATTLFYDGMEAPATSLVLLASPLPPLATTAADDTSHRILTQQHLLNSGYLESCHPQCQDGEQASLTMWPVLPFRL